MSAPRWGSKSSESSPPKRESQNILSRFIGNLANVVRSAPQIPSALVREFNEGLGYITGASRVPSVGRFLGQRVPGQAAESVGKRAPTFSDTLEEIKRRKSTAPIAEAPGIRLLSGAYTASRLGGGGGGVKELLENPGYVLLDLLPFGSRLGKVATKGSRLAGEAAETARLAGRPAKAVRISQEGLKLHEMGAALGRRTAPGKAVAGVLRRSGVGGPEARGTAIRISQAENLFRDAVANHVAPIMGKDTGMFRKAFGNRDIPSLSAKHGVSLERMRQITQEADFGSPGWKERLLPNERSLVDETASIVKELSEVGSPFDKTKLFEFRGRVYGPEARTLRAAIKKFEAATARVERIQDGTGKGLDEALNKQRLAANQVERFYQRTSPAEFQSALQPRIREALTRHAEDIPDVVDRAEALRMIAENARRDIPGITNAKVLSIIRGVAGGWRRLVDEGYDPQFIPHVRPDQVGKLGFPKLISDRVPALAGEKARTLHPEPWVPDLEIALSVRAYERLGQIHSEQLVKTLDEAKILTTPSKVDAAARQIGRDRGLDPLAMPKFIEDYVNRNYESWSPEGLFPFGQFRVAGRTPAYLVPKGVGGVIDRFKPPAQHVGAKLGRFSSELLRTGVLDLNPMYYVGNAITAMTRQLVRGSPADLLYFPKALKMILQDKIPPELMRGARMQAVETAEQGRYLLGGKTLGRLATEAEGTMQVSRSGIKRVFKVRDALRQLASTIDDMGRTVAYLGGQRRGLRKGLTDIEAKNLGLEQAAKVLNGMDDMLPLERAIVRNLAPFFGWVRFIAGTVLSYPFDHPLRVAFVTALAREVEDDWIDGLPERFRSYFFFGDPTKLPPGKIMGISASFALPEVSVANLFTVAGFLSRVAPQYQAMLRLSGADEYGGGPELYPNLKWDPVQGRDVWERPPLPQTIAAAFLPQLGNILLPEELAFLREEDPETYKRLVMGQLGLRLPYEIDLAEEVQKASERKGKAEARELREEQAQTKQPQVPARTGGAPRW